MSIALIVVLIAIIVLQMIAIVYLSWDSEYKCPTRGLYNIVSPALLRTGAKVLFIDLDGFGKVNSKYGYDQANKIVAQAIKSAWTGRMIVPFRYFSGDEFVVFMFDERRPVNRLVLEIQCAFVEAGLPLTGAIGTDPKRLSKVVSDAKPKDADRPMMGKIMDENGKEVIDN